MAGRKRVWGGRNGLGEGVVEGKRKNQRHASGSLASCSSCRFLRRGPGGATFPPLHLSHHYLSPRPPYAHIPPTSSGSPACKGVVGRSWGGGGGLRVSNLVLINKPTCAAAAAATHPTIPDISPAPLRGKKASPSCLPPHPSTRTFVSPPPLSVGPASYPRPLQHGGTNGRRK